MERSGSLRRNALTAVVLIWIAGTSGVSFRAAVAMDEAVPGDGAFGLWMYAWIVCFVWLIGCQVWIAALAKPQPDDALPRGVVWRSLCGAAVFLLAIILLGVGAGRQAGGQSVAVWPAFGALVLGIVGGVLLTALAVRLREVGTSGQQS